MILSKKSATFWDHASVESTGREVRCGVCLGCFLARGRSTLPIVVWRLISCLPGTRRACRLIAIAQRQLIKKMPRANCGHERPAAIENAPLRELSACRSRGLLPCVVQGCRPQEL